MKLVTAKNKETGEVQHFYLIFDDFEYVESKNLCLRNTMEYIKTLIQISADNIIKMCGTDFDFSQENVESKFIGIERKLVKIMLHKNHQYKFKNPLLALGNAVEMLKSVYHYRYEPETRRMTYIGMHDGESLFYEKFDEKWDTVSETDTNIIFGFTYTTENFENSPHYTRFLLKEY